jgi:Arc/MetJ-type ribon-helix-helix transcriptional regulator
MKEKFENQDEVVRALVGSSRRNYKDEINRLEIQIQFLNLRITEEKVCDTEWQKINEFQNQKYGSSEIEQLITNLRIFKREDKYNKHC